VTRGRDPQQANVVPSEPSRWQESNLHLSLRRTLFYPLNYSESGKYKKCAPPPCL
jgi:hypothetical protein